jgi:hypothetical protein
MKILVLLKSGKKNQKLLLHFAVSNTVCFGTKIGTKMPGTRRLLLNSLFPYCNQGKHELN